MLQCYNACIWTNISLNNKIQRNYKGLKITACMRIWGKFWTRYKEKLGAKAGYCTCSLHIIPPKGWAKHLSHPSAQTHPYPNPI